MIVCIFMFLHEVCVLFSLQWVWKRIKAEARKRIEVVPWLYCTSFPLSISSVNVTKSAVLVTSTEEILNGKLRFLGSVTTHIYFRSSTRPNVATIAPVDDKSNHTVSLEDQKDDGCSLSALITVKMKSPDEDSTVILAEEEG